jgi:hypothetical protein
MPRLRVHRELVQLLMSYAGKLFRNRPGLSGVYSIMRRFAGWHKDGLVTRPYKTSGAILLAGLLLHQDLRRESVSDPLLRPHPRPRTGGTSRPASPPSRIIPAPGLGIMLSKPVAWSTSFRPSSPIAGDASHIIIITTGDREGTCLCEGQRSDIMGKHLTQRYVPSERLGPEGMRSHSLDVGTVTLSAFTFGRTLGFSFGATPIEGHPISAKKARVDPCTSLNRQAKKPKYGERL